MQYFINTPYTEATLKAEFRQYALNLHPDRGGSEEEFKNMFAEYTRILNGLDGLQDSAAEARKAAAEYAQQQQRRAEEEKLRREREEYERVRRAREQEQARQEYEIMQAAIDAWSGILERVGEDKSSAAAVAATKRNIKKIVDKYFPGLKIKIVIRGEIYREKFEILWEDGPSEIEMCRTCPELDFFIPSVYLGASAWEDYGHYVENVKTSQWREMFGQALGYEDECKTIRHLSAKGVEQAEQVAAQYLVNFNREDENFIVTLSDFAKFARVIGVPEDEINRSFRDLTDQYELGYGSWDEITGTASRRRLYAFLSRYMSVNIKQKVKINEFSPSYGPRYQAIKKALGSNVFFEIEETAQKASFFKDNVEISIFEAAERLANGEPVTLGQKHQDSRYNETYIYGTTNGGYKVQQKRFEKFAAVGIALHDNNNIYATVKAVSIDPEALEELRKEAADIERQRAAWEAAQAGPTPVQTETDQPADDHPADGLALVDIPGGVAVVGDSRTTYKNRKAIKAHGATWSKVAQQWQGLTAEAVQSLREWFGVGDDPTPDQDPESETTAEPVPDPEPQPAPAPTPVQNAAKEASPAAVAADLLEVLQELPNNLPSGLKSDDLRLLAHGVTLTGDADDAARMIDGAKCLAGSLVRRAAKIFEGCQQMEEALKSTPIPQGLTEEQEEAADAERDAMNEDLNSFYDYYETLMDTAHTIAAAIGVEECNVEALALLAADDNAEDPAQLALNFDDPQPPTDSDILEQAARIRAAYEAAKAEVAAEPAQSEAGTEIAENITYIKYCPNVYLAKCERQHTKGDIVYITTKKGNTHEIEIFNFIGKTKSGFYAYSFTRTDGMNKATMAARRAERRQEWAEKADAESMRYFEKSEEAVAGIVPGQPIIIGHHSEKAHRAALERSWNAMGHSVAASDKAKHHREKAVYWQGKAEDITLDMPESLEFFQKKLEEAIEYHQGVKSGKYPREHAFTLTYAKKNVNELTKKVEIAKKLWGNNEI